MWFGERVVGSVMDDGRGGAYYFKQDMAGFPGGYFDVITAVQAGKTYYSANIIDSSSNTVINSWSDTWVSQAGSAPLAYSGAAQTARQFTDNSIGALPHGGNVSPAQKYLLAYTLGNRSTGPTPGCVMWLYDRVLSYDECPIAAASTTMTNTLTAQRWVGTGLPGLRTVLTSSQTATGVTASNLSVMTYTDELNVAGNLVPYALPINASSTAISTARFADVLTWSSATSGQNYGPFLPCAAGDGGQKSIQNYTCTAANTGTMCFALIRPRMMMVVPDAGLLQSVDCIRDRFAFLRVYDGACLGFLSFQGETGILTTNLTFVYN